MLGSLLYFKVYSLMDIGVFGYILVQASVEGLGEIVGK